MTQNRSKKRHAKVKTTHNSRHATAHGGKERRGLYRPLERGTTWVPAEPIRDSRRKAAEPARLCPAPGKPCEAYWSGSVDLPNRTQSTQSASTVAVDDTPFWPKEISVESASDPKRTATVRAQIQLRLGTQYVRGACGYTRPVGEPSPCCCTTPPTPCVSQATRMRATRHKPGGRGGDAVVPSRLEVAFSRLVGLARRRRPPPNTRALPDLVGAWLSAHDLRRSHSGSARR